MNAKKCAAVAALIFSLTVVCAGPGQTQAQDDKDKYPNMAPLDQYMMERDAEIALARTAAPEDISRDATVLVMGRHGHETAVEGKNGFVCLVERARMAPFDNPGFWNSKNRNPDCYNPPSARTVLPLIKMRTEMVLAKLSPSSGRVEPFAPGTRLRPGSRQTAT